MQHHLLGYQILNYESLSDMEWKTFPSLTHYSPFLEPQLSPMILAYSHGSREF